MNSINSNKQIESVLIKSGRDKSGMPEKIDELEIRKGQIYSIVGFTGSGKSQLISDIEQVAQNDTVTGRQVLIDGRVPGYRERYNPEAKLVAQLSQNMNFVLETTVKEFILMHAECRGMKNIDGVVDEVLDNTNGLAGEAVREDDILTRLSGGQSRALMISDVAVISCSPIILIDEVENAGIDRRKAMELLAVKGKIILIVTHDPQLALLGEKRIVMENGGMTGIVETTKEEREAEKVLMEYTRKILTAQRMIRAGESLTVGDLVPELVESA